MIAWSIITYLARGIGLTINLIFVLKKLMSNFKFSKTYPNNHGLDHEFLQSEFLV